MTGVAAFVSGGTCFHFEYVGTDHITAVSCDFGSVRQDTTVFFDFKHRFSPPILL